MTKNSPGDVSDTKAATGPDVVALADFESVDIEAPVVGLRSVDCCSFSDPFRKAADEVGDSAAARVYRLLSDVTQIHFKADDQAEPFGPMLVVDGRRSIIPDDLRGAQSETFAAIAQGLKNPGLRARITDIVWLNDRKQAAMAQLAVAAYCEAVRLVAEGQAEFAFDECRASSHRGAENLRRACQIANATGWKDPEASVLKSMIDTLTRQAAVESNPDGFLNVGELSLDYDIGDPAVIGLQAEGLATKEGLFPDTARLAWEMAAQAHHYAKSEDDSNRCLINAAECYVTMAADSGFKGMVAASWLMDAIKALRQLPGTKQRRTELESKLRDAQSSIRDEMGVISTEIDLSALVDHARKTVGGLTLSKALGEFASLDASPNPEQLRREALEQAEKYPLSSIIPMAFYDDEDKLVARSPGLMGDKASEETAIRHLIARNEGMRRHLTVSGSIEPARRTIMAEHPLSIRHFLPLAALSPFVPSGHENIYANGFARFFGGDFISALHVLVPQIENSLRHVLMQTGVDPSKVKCDMTQENWTISIMLNNNREVLEKIFGPAIVLEIENIFDMRVGPTIRHNVAHGRMSTSDFHSPNAIYACWFIFRLCCLPLFKHWDKVARAYAAV